MLNIVAIRFLPTTKNYLAMEFVVEFHFLIDMKVILTDP